MVTVLRAVAEQQLFSDDPNDFITHVLDKGVADGHLLSYTLDALRPATWTGVALAQFTVNLRFGDYKQMHPEDAKVKVTDLLNAVIGDTDVDVRWLYAEERNVPEVTEVACSWPEDERDRSSHYRNHPDCNGEVERQHLVDDAPTVN